MSDGLTPNELKGDHQEYLGDQVRDRDRAYMWFMLKYQIEQNPPAVTGNKLTRLLRRFRSK